MENFEYKEEYGWMTRVCLNVTDACNLACKYCFVEQHPHYMDLQTAKDAAHFILKNLEKKNKKFNKNEKAKINFFGGEPMLLYDEIIVPLVNYVKENNLPIDFGMTTNGTLLDEEKILFFKQNNFSLLLSIDGDEYTQNFNRPCQNKNLNSFDLVKKNIPILLKYYPNITFRSTIYSKTVEKTFENYVFAIQQGFKNIFMIPDSRHPWTELEKEQLHQEVHKIYSFLDFCFTSGKGIPINCKPIEESFQKFYEQDLKLLNPVKTEREINRSPFRCGFGINGYGSIGYDGSIMGCQEQVSKNNINNIFYLGNIYQEGVEKDRQENLIKDYIKKIKTCCINKKQCEQCYFNKTCTQEFCPSTSIDLFNKFLIMPEIYCLWKEWLTLDAIILNNKLVEENNEMYKNFLLNRCKFNIYKEKGEEHGV